MRIFFDLCNPKVFDLYIFCCHQSLDWNHGAPFKVLGANIEVIIPRQDHKSSGGGEGQDLIIAQYKILMRFVSLVGNFKDAQISRA